MKPESNSDQGFVAKCISKFRTFVVARFSGEAKSRDQVSAAYAVVLAIAFAPLFYLFINLFLINVSETSPNRAWGSSHDVRVNSIREWYGAQGDESTKECSDRIAKGNERFRILEQLDNTGDLCLLEYLTIPENSEEGDVGFFVNYAIVSPPKSESAAESSDVSEGGRSESERGSVQNAGISDQIQCSSQASSIEAQSDNEISSIVMRVGFGNSSSELNIGYELIPCSVGYLVSPDERPAALIGDVSTLKPLMLGFLKPLSIAADSKQLSLELYELSQNLGQEFSSWRGCPRCADKLEVPEDSKSRFERAIQQALNPFFNRTFVEIDAETPSELCSFVDCETNLSGSMTAWQFLNGPDATGLIQFAIVVLAGIILAIGLYMYNHSQYERFLVLQRLRRLRDFALKAFSDSSSSDSLQSAEWKLAREHIDKQTNEFPAAGLFALRDCVHVLSRTKSIPEARDAALVQLSVAQESSSSKFRLLEVLLGLILPIGFLGTVIGISGAMGGVDGMLADAMSTKQKELTSMAANMKSAFFTTAMALLWFLLLSPLVGWIQRSEEGIRNELQSGILDFLKDLQREPDTEYADISDLAPRPDLIRPGGKFVFRMIIGIVLFSALAFGVLALINWVLPNLV